MAAERIIKTETRKANKRHTCQCGEVFEAGTMYVETTGVRSNGMFFRTKDADHFHKGTQLPMFKAHEPVLPAEKAKKAKDAD